MGGLSLRKRLFFRGGAIVLIALFSSFGFLNLPSFGAPISQDFGVTFSPGQAASLGLDWREVFISTLDDLGVRHFRLSAYWNMVQPTPDAYDFTDLDFQLDNAARRDAKVILAVGRKLPRWPECHDPKWYGGLSLKKQKEALLAYERTVIERYKFHPAVVMWQIENEPTFPFGICPNAFGLDMLQEEVALARSLDTRKVMVTDSGEWTLWLPLALYGDVLGSSLYRGAWNDYLGYIPFPIRPGYYQARAAYIHSLKKDIIISELQTEPWGKKSIQDMTTAEMSDSFPINKFDEHVQFSKEVGFSQVYLWGVEWWYLMKQRGVPEYWDQARDVFRGST